MTAELASGLLVGLLSVAGPARPARRRRHPPGPPPPNVVLLMTDDQTVGDMAVMRRTRRLLGAGGCDVRPVGPLPYPLCCPSRATFLTGQYAHNNRVLCLYPEVRRRLPAA